MTNKIRLGFLGAGWWATANHLPILKERSEKADDVELVGVCRLGKEELQTVKDTFGFKFATEDYQELLNLDLDGVVVVTPHQFHYEHAKAALDRGMHVMVEKPMALEAGHAWDLVKTADQKNLHLIVPHGWHYKPFIFEAKKQLDQGAVGRIEHVLCHMASPTRELFSGEDFKMDFGGMFQSDLSIYSKSVKGGGYSWGQLTHSIGMMLWLTNLAPEEIFAYMSHSGAKEVDMHQAISLRFKNGALATISGSSSVPAGMLFQVDIRIYGTEGMLLLDVERERMEISRHDKQDVSLDIEPGTGAYSCEGPPNRFVDLILGKETENLSPGLVAAGVTSILEAAHTSSQTRKPEKVVYLEN